MSEVRLPDTVWLKILGHLEHQDLMSVILLERETNWFVSGIAKDKTLWRRVLWRANPSLKPGKVVSDVKKIVPYLKSYTTSIHIEGSDQKGKQFKVSEALLQSIRLHCTKLKHLALVNCRLDYFTRPFRNLPRTLIRLSLKNVKVDNLPFLRTLASSPLVGLGKVLTGLKEVVITQDCDWFIKPDEAALKSTLKQVQLERIWT